jgi:predicted CXXCH cytochrome family protein
MAPGFEFPDHFELQRVVERRCMSCHNGYPELPAGADAKGMPALFPPELPEGIGCQRCHGPGAGHVALAIERDLGGAVTVEALRGAILNPGEFTAKQQRDLCASCHFQPTVAVNAPLRLGVGAMGFRPGDRLDAHVAHIDITDALRAPTERFDINHHPYRLEQSACFVETGGTFGCLSCHDPHGKAPAAQRAAQVRGVCLDCHSSDTVAALHPAMSVPEADCASCHMPKRRTQDVIEVTMTDHLIQIPPDGDLTARIAKRPPEVTAVRLIEPAADLRPGEGVIYQTMAILSHTNSRDAEATAALARVLDRYNPPYFEPWLRLDRALYLQGDDRAALAALRRAMQLAPDHPGPLALGALARARQGFPEVALEMLGQSLDLFPGMPEQHLNKAVIHRSLGEHMAALAEARQALALQFNLWSAWRLIGETYVDLGEPAQAIAAFEAALAIEPGADRVRPALITALRAEGRLEEAARHEAFLARP